MNSDRERPSRLQAEQDRAVVRYLRHQVFPYSSFYRSLFERSGVPAAAMQTPPARARLPLTRLAEIADPAALVLRPEPDRVSFSGAPGLAASLRWAAMTGKTASAARRRIDPL